jgi:hypothetical protein
MAESGDGRSRKVTRIGLPLYVAPTSLRRRLGVLPGTPVILLPSRPRIESFAHTPPSRTAARMGGRAHRRAGRHEVAPGRPP